MVILILRHLDIRMLATHIRSDTLTMLIMARRGVRPAARSLWWIWLLSGRKGLGCWREPNSEHRKDETNCQRAGVTHENLGVFLDIAEHIIIEERHEHAESGKGYDRHGIFSKQEEGGPEGKANHGETALIPSTLPRLENQTPPPIRIAAQTSCTTNFARYLIPMRSSAMPTR